MKLRFHVNQAEAFRQGVDSPTSIVTVEVDPADLPQKDRDLIADRMRGIDICLGRYKLPREQVSGTSADPATMDGEKTDPRIIEPSGDRIVVDPPTFEGLLSAVREDQKKLEAEHLDLTRKSGTAE